MSWTDKYPVGSEVGLTSTVDECDPTGCSHYDGTVTENADDGSLAVAVRGSRIFLADEAAGREMAIRPKSEEG